MTFLSTNATLVYVLSHIKSAVILSMYLCICPVTDISATVTPIGVKFCMMVLNNKKNIGLQHKVSPFGGGTSNCLMITGLDQAYHAHRFIFSFTDVTK